MANVNDEKTEVLFDRPAIQFTVFFAAMVLLAAAFYLITFERPGSIQTFIAAGVCLFFASLSKFKRFSLGPKGVDTELQDLVHEGKSVISRVQSLMAPMAELAFTLVALSKRPAGISNRKSYELVKEIEEALKRLGLSEEQVAGAKERWHFYNLYDLASPILNDLVELLDKKWRAEKKMDLRRLLEAEFEEVAKIHRSPNLRNTRDTVAELIERSAFLSDEDGVVFLAKYSEQLEDWQHYCENLEFRRLEIWFTQDEK